MSARLSAPSNAPQNKRFFTLSLSRRANDLRFERDVAPEKPKTDFYATKSRFKSQNQFVVRNGTFNIRIIQLYTKTHTQTTHYTAAMNERSEHDESLVLLLSSTTTRRPPICVESDIILLIVLFCVCFVVRVELSAKAIRTKARAHSLDSCNTATKL